MGKNCSTSRGSLYSLCRCPRVRVSCPEKPTRLYDVAGLRQGANIPEYDVSPDGQQFIIAQPVGDAPPPTIRIVQNWFAKFRDREQNQRAKLAETNYIVLIRGIPVAKS